MSNTVGEIYDVIDALAPFDTQASFDNAGLNVGSRSQVCDRTLVCLDITLDTINEAKSIGAQCIVSHHPVLFNPVRQMPSDGELYALAQAGLSAVCAHTNWDQAKGGVGDVLFSLVTDGAENEPVYDEEGCCFIRIGKTKDKYDLFTFTENIKKKLSSAWVQVVDGGKPVKTVAVVGGAGGSEIERCVASGADTLVTGEVKHHEMLLAARLGLNLICAGHFETENPSMKILRDILAEKLPSTEFVLSAVRPPFRGV